MTTMARTERTELCDTALQVGEDQPTLCEGWTVKDLVVHLLLRERNVAAAGIVLKPLAGLLERETRRYARQDFTVLVERLRQGPPPWSPFALPKADALLNTVELFVHHEDIRRAQESWEPRALPGKAPDALWKTVRVAGKGLVRSAGAGVVLERSDSGERAELSSGTATVVVRGLPSELTMFVYGRQRHARVELDGPDDAVAALRGADLGV
ncbi:MAG: TIGR03085 family metal-binding protein [Nocardioidaceae bacterium]